MPDELPSSHDASADAIHKAKNAAAAIEYAREAQLAEAIQKTAEQTKAALLEGLIEVFGKGDDVGSGEMNILVRRIPLICQDVKDMKNDIGEIKDSIKWGVRAVIGAVIVGLLGLLFTAIT